MVGGMAAIPFIFREAPNLSGMVNSGVASFHFVPLIVMLIASAVDALLLARGHNKEGQATGTAPW